ncbi:MAG: DUF4041 domain-containing protein [Myxococcales bacterium]|nr:MAG: DUF4041 domain-containing protein [Myxococcales bacterium]
MEFFLGFALILVVILAISLWSEVRGLRGSNAALASEREALLVNNDGLHRHSEALQYRMERIMAENQDLGRYRPVLDVDREVYHRRAAIAAAEAAAQQQAAAVVGGANQQAAAVMTDAYTKAQLIAADALDAKRNMETYRQEGQALRNIVEGYGDRYLVATETVLDALAEQYSHTDAGSKLKEMRDRSRRMIKEKRAAECDYVEAERRAAAIEFVIDAFNGKAETTLAKAKMDNFGTLYQQLVDAAALVNMNGRAFRNARVSNVYVEARVEELRWAVVVHELREREKEEQRRIKERIREEEKARRDFERAQREAAKEEDAIRRAMDRARSEIAQATDAQRAQYEAQLEELSLRLQAAEEKNQRALSMAQQTRRGHVYIISNLGSFGEDVFKIGLTRRLEPLDRIRELGDASVPFEFDVHALIFSEDAPALEHSLHRHFLAAQLNKVNPRKEFFRASLTMIREEVEKLGLQASWTMTASAVQYRESQAIERAIKEDPAAYNAWVNRQLVLERVLESEADEDASAPTLAAVASAAN